MTTVKQIINKTQMEQIIGEQLNGTYQGRGVKIVKGEIISCDKAKFVIKNVVFGFYDENVLMAGKNKFYPISSYYIQFFLIDKKNNLKTIRLKDINHLPQL